MDRYDFIVNLACLVWTACGATAMVTGQAGTLIIAAVVTILTVWCE
jgi:hypothetical protein